MRGFATLIIAVLTAGAAWAQVNVGTYGDWTMQCVAIGVGKTNCGLRQTVVTADGASLIAEVNLERTYVQGAPRALLVINTPQSMALNQPISYSVDGEGEIVALSWRTCADGICRAAVLLTAEQEAALKAGGKMIAAYRRLQSDKPLGFPVSLRGVTAGMNALTRE